MSGKAPGSAVGPPVRQVDPSELEARLVELELKAVWSEDLLEQLDRVVVRQQARIEGLARELAHLRERLAAAEAAAAAGGTAPSLRDEIPPHY